MRRAFYDPGILWRGKETVAQHAMRSNRCELPGYTCAELLSLHATVDVGGVESSSVTNTQVEGIADSVEVRLAPRRLFDVLEDDSSKSVWGGQS